MKYDTAYDVLTNGYPRTVAAGDNGSLKQTFVHSKKEAEVYFDGNIDNKNLYFNIARFRSDMRPVTGLVPFDFDSPLKESAFTDDENDRQKIKKLREDNGLASEVLGKVWADVQSTVRWAKNNNVPAISVFSGLGVHTYLLYQEEVNPVEKKTTTSQHIIEELDLGTYDRKIIPDTKRILRVPNSKRIDNGIDCRVFCIPMTEHEVLNNSIHDVLERSKNPKELDTKERYKESNRPKMKKYEDVDVDNRDGGTVSVSEYSDVPEDVKEIVHDFIGLPCVAERFISSNPHHMVRFNGVAWLYQSGFTPKEVREIIRQIGWKDYDEKITKKMTNQIWSRRYSESSCSSMRRLGLCVYGMDMEDYEGEPENCETFNYTSGEALYPYENENNAY